MLRRRVEQFARTLDAPSLTLVSPVQIDEGYITVGPKGRERESRSRSHGLTMRGRETYEEDKPPIFTFVDSTERPISMKSSPCYRNYRVQDVFEKQQRVET